VTQPRLIRIRSHYPTKELRLNFEVNYWSGIILTEAPPIVETTDAPQRRVRHPPDRGYSTMRTLFLLFIVGLWSITQPIQQNPSQATPQPPFGVQLVLTASKTDMQIGGEPIILRVELWNRGKEDFPAGADLVPVLNHLAHVKLEGWNENGQRVFLFDSIQATGVSRYDEWWNMITPGHFYGTEYKLDPLDFEFVKTPGDYRLVATYISRGGTIPANAERQFPAQTVWKGELTSHSLSVRVRPVTQARSHK
jgi:hypothetical protein